MKLFIYVISLDSNLLGVTGPRPGAAGGGAQQQPTSQPLNRSYDETVEISQTAQSIATPPKGSTMTSQASRSTTQKTQEKPCIYINI